MWRPILEKGARDAHAFPRTGSLVSDSGPTPKMTALCTYLLGVATVATPRSSDESKEPELE